MTRKDTIMIAVLVNAALLIALFVSAIKNDDVEQVASNSVALEVSPIELPDPVKKEVCKTIDEIDQVIKEFTEKKVVQVEKPKQKIDFAKELEAITKAANPEPKTKPSSKSDGNYTVVTVKKGDVLEKIARIHNMSVSDIMSSNHLSNTVLQIGQKLKIPAKGQSVKSSSEAAFYTVRQGDNPWTIAVKNQLKVDELLRLNDLNEEKARRLRPGDKLRIK